VTKAPDRRTRLVARTTVVALLASAWLRPAYLAAETVVLVQAGDSLSSIAFDHGVTVEALMAANGLDDPDLVFMGQELVIPGTDAPTTTSAPLVVIVEYGESLSIIAARHGVTVAAVMAANDLSDPDRIYVGQELTIPSATAPTTTAPPGTTLPALVVTVEFGDSLSVIADRHGVTVSAIMEANGITNPDRLSVGQQLVIPGVAAPDDPTVPSTDYGDVVVEGRGWGHGRGMGQYGALGYAIDEGWSRDQILDHFYGGTTAGNVGDLEIGVRLLAHDGEPTTVYVEDALLGLLGDGEAWMQVYDSAVRVRLVESTGRWSVSVGASCAGPFSDTGVVLDGDVVRILPAHLVVPTPTTTTSTTTSTTTTTAAPETTTTTTTTSTTTTSAPETTTTTPSTTPPDPVFTVIDAADVGLDQTLQVCEGSNAATWYRGEVRAAHYGDQQRTVNVLPVEHYLRSVVPREMPASWADLGEGAGAQALQVQAVAARSYSLAEDRYDYARTCDTIRCQVYEGRQSRRGDRTWSNEDDRSDAAIQATAGLVRMWGDEVARTEFSASTGGHTITVDFPGVPDAGDDVEVNPVHRWTTELTVQDIEHAFGVDDLYEVWVAARDGFGDDGGRVDQLELRERDGDVVTITGNRFRREFGLKSNWFSVTFEPPDASAGFPELRYDEYRVTTGYTEEEWALVTSGAEYLDMHPSEFQRAAVWVTSFLLNLSSNPDGPAPLDPPPAVDGPEAMKTAYFAEGGDQVALEHVAGAFAVNGAEAQKVATTVLVFLVGLSRARQGG